MEHNEDSPCRQRSKNEQTNLSIRTSLNDRATRKHTKEVNNPPSKNRIT